MPDRLLAKDPVNQLALEKLRAAGESPSGPFPALNLVLQALEDKNHGLRPAHAYDLENALYFLLRVDTPKQVEAYSKHLWSALGIDLLSARQLSKDQYANLLLKYLWEFLGSLDYPPVSNYPINPSRPAM